MLNGPRPSMKAGKLKSAACPAEVDESVPDPSASPPELKSTRPVGVPLPLAAATTATMFSVSFKGSAVALRDGQRHGQQDRKVTTIRVRSGRSAVAHCSACPS